MKLFSFLSILFVFFTLQNTAAQNWQIDLNIDKHGKIIGDGQVNFFELQKSFSEYWQNREIKPGSGYKPFKRWEWLMQSRVDKKGLFDNKALWKVWQEKKHRFPKAAGLNNSAWTNLGPKQVPPGNWTTNGLGRLNCLAVDPKDTNKIWVGSPSGGLWKSTDGGKTWATNTDFLDCLGVSSILISPFDSNIMYISTGDFDGRELYSIGILESTDGGETWFLPCDIDLTIGSVSRKLLMDPEDENTIYVCGKRGIMKSVNGGLDWTNTTDDSYDYFYDLVMDKSNPSILYASAMQEKIFGSYNIVIKSTDKGDSWSMLTNGLPSNEELIGRSALAISNSNPNILYAVFTNWTGPFYGIYKSTDGGASWVRKAKSPNLMSGTESGSGNDGQPNYDLVFAVDPTDPEVIYLGGINLWKSTDSGSNWNLITHYSHSANSSIAEVHPDFHALEFIPNTKSLLAGNDGGLYKSNDGGTTWQNLSNGLEIQQFYRIGSSAQEPDFILAGAQDNGTSMLKDGAWKNLFGGDGMECMVDYSNPNIVYLSCQMGDLYKSMNGSDGPFENISDGIPGRSAWVAPFLIHPSNPELLFTSTDRVYRSTNRGITWQAISGVLEHSSEIPQYLTAIRVCKSQPLNIFACSLGNIFKTTDAGATWSKTEPPSFISKGFISDIAVDPNNPKIIYAASSTVSTSVKIVKSTDGGDSWTDITGAIPQELPINCITIQDNCPTEVYIGTDIGVFYSSAGGEEWHDYSSNLPNVIVSELEIDKKSGKLRAATYGRGLWETSLNHPNGNVDDEDIIPSEYSLLQNYPNPFNPKTTIKYGLPTESSVKIEIYNSLGEIVTELVNEVMEEGFHKTNFDATGLSSGIYFYSLEVKATDGTTSYRDSKKMIILK